MAEIIVFAVFMVLWKALDTGLGAYQLYLQAKVEFGKGGDEDRAEEGKRIGFVDYGDRRIEVEEEGE